MRWRWLFLVLGSALLGLLISSYGLETLRQDYERIQIGGLILLTLTFVPTLLGYSAAWLLCTPGARPRELPFFIQASVQSYAWNQLTPLVKIGGEFTKYHLLKSRRYPDPLQSVLVYNLAHTLGTVLSFSIGGLILVLFYAVDPILSAFFIGGSLFLGLLSFVLIFSPGVFYQLILRFGKREWATPFARIRAWIEATPLRMGLAIFLETLSRLVEGITFYIAFRLLEEPISLLGGTLLEIARSFIDTAIFFVPYNLGVREGSVPWVLAEIFKEPKTMALSAVLLYRWVELSWTVLGFLLWIFSSRQRRSGQSLG